MKSLILSTGIFILSISCSEGLNLCFGVKRQNIVEFYSSISNSQMNPLRSIILDEWLNFLSIFSKFSLL
jgi:hypothetical protein